MSPRRYDYTLRIDPELNIIAIRVCPPPGERLPHMLSPGAPHLAPYLTAAEGPGGALPQGEQGVDTSMLDTDACADLRIDAGRAANELNSSRSAAKKGDALVTSPDLWLYRDIDDGKRTCEGTMTAQLPEGIFMSAPWPKAASKRRILDDTAFSWLSRVAFGPHEPLVVKTPTAQLEVFVLDSKRGPSDDVARGFLTEVSRALSLSTGSLPRAFTQVTLESTPFSEDVAFGLVLRGGGPGAHLLLSPRASADTLARAWVPTHELSHLFLPFVGSRGRFVSEGLATYYQNVLRARAGLVSEEQAWAKLHAGMVRGKNAADGQTPIESSLAMNSRGNYSHIYWSGTALFLLIDVALRTRTENPSSVDAVLSVINDCCLRPRRYIDIETLARRIDDRIGGDDMFRLTHAIGTSATFPEFERVYAALGLAVEGDDIVIVEADNPLRSAITGKRDHAQP